MTWCNKSARPGSGGIAFRERGLLEKSAADTHGLFEWRTRADVFQSFPRRKFRQSAADPPWSEADCRGTNLVRRVRGGFRVGNFYSALTDDIRLPFSLGEKRKLRAARGSGITATNSAKNENCRIPRRRRSDPLGPTRTQADSIGVRRGIVPPTILPGNGIKSRIALSLFTFETFYQKSLYTVKKVC